MVVGQQCPQAAGGGGEIAPADEADVRQAEGTGGQTKATKEQGVEPIGGQGGAEQVVDPHEGQQLLLIGCQLQSLAKPVTGALGHRHDVTSSAAARA